jgi:hypothetical protein
LAERKLPGDRGLAFVPLGFVAAQCGADFRKLGKGLGLFSLPSRLRIDYEIQIDIVFFALSVVGNIVLYLFPHYAFRLFPQFLSPIIIHFLEIIYKNQPNILRQEVQKRRYIVRYSDVFHLVGRLNPYTNVVCFVGGFAMTVKLSNCL